MKINFVILFLPSTAIIYSSYRLSNPQNPLKIVSRICWPFTWAALTPTLGYSGFIITKLSFFSPNLTLPAFLRKA